MLKFAFLKFFLAFIYNNNDSKLYLKKVKNTLQQCASLASANFPLGLQIYLVLRFSFFVSLIMNREN